MELHLVGGFLGSGKTTAIIQAARMLTGRGLKVGIITNEQGKHLVDTAYIQAQGLPALEVTGGCICCHLDDFEERVEEIAERYNPQVLFAESVGSCTDLVATVIKPLSDLRKTSARPASLSVFADSRLLLRFLRGQEMPFSEGIVYIFEKQIEEAGLLVVNKIDLLSAQDAGDVNRLAQERYPKKLIRPQNSLDEREAGQWLALIQSRTMALPDTSLDLDYDAYADGEGRFAWLDREIEFNQDATGDLLAHLIRKILIGFTEGKFQIAHVKFLVIFPTQIVKLNMTCTGDPAFERQLEEVKRVNSKPNKLIVNVMMEGNLTELEEILDNIIGKFSKEKNIRIRETAKFNRVPGFPQPTMRIGN